MTASARESILYGWARVMDYNEAFSTLAMIFIVLQKRGDIFFQLMGRVSGKANLYSPICIPGNTSPSLWGVGRPQAYMVEPIR